MKLRTFAGIAAGCGVAFVGTAGCGADDSAPSSSSGLPAPVNGVYSVQIESSTPAGLPKCTSALSGTVAYVSSPSALWACSGGNWCAINCATSSAGDVAYASSTQTLVACVSNAWTPVALPQGPKGPQGDAGPPGPQGPQGPRGDAGATGPTGAQGSQGIPGEAGAQGAQGNAGATGAVGPVGPQGAQGTAGADGGNGLNSLIAVSTLAIGSSQCPTGGEEIQVGQDLNGNGILDPNEVQNTAFVCNGAGESGPPDAASGDGIAPEAGDAGPSEATLDAAADGGADSETTDAGCTSTMALIGGGSTAFGATWSAGAWSVQAFPNASLASAPSIVSYSGGWLAAFEQTGGALASATFAGAWDPPTAIGTGGTVSTQASPSLAVLGVDAHVVYLGLDNKYYHGVFTGGAWDTAVDAVCGSGSQALGNSAPSLAGFSDALVVAFQYAGVRECSWDLGSWGPAYVISSDSEQNVAPRVAALGNSSEQIVVWSSATSSTLAWSANTFPLPGAWGEEFVGEGFSSQQTALAVLANGGVDLAYEGTDGNAYLVTGQVELGNQTPVTWGTPSALLPTGNPQLASQPSIAPGVCGDDAEVAYVAADGTVHVASVRGTSATDAVVALAPSATFVAIATRP